jgi:flavorubredoxin
MIISRPVTDKVFWVGAVDWDRRLFDALIPLPDGTSYNAYLVRGADKTVLIDAVEPCFLDVLKAHLADVPDIDYVVANHAEQDHSGGIPWVLRKYPRAVVLCSAPCRQMLIDHLLVAPERIRAVADGERLELGGRTLRFIYAPWVHWPETMVTFLEEEGLLFSCDWFGSHLATAELFVEDGAHIKDEAKRYFAEIMMPFRRTIGQNLEKIKDLDIRTIAPSHGPLHRNPRFILDAYREWISDTPRNLAVIPWVSMHGSTEKMVHHLAGALSERGVAVQPFNMTVTDIGHLAMELVDAATLIVGAPTVHVGPHPAVLTAVHLANALRPKVRFAGFVGSYGWGGKSAETVKALLPNLKAEFLEPVLAKGYPKEADFRALDAQADAVAKRHRDRGLK